MLRSSRSILYSRGCGFVRDQSFFTFAYDKSIELEEVESVIRSRGCSARCAYWNVNYFGVIRVIAMARSVVGHREQVVSVACWPSIICGCSYELLIRLTTSLKTIHGDCW